MPPYVTLALMMSCAWLILLIVRKDMRMRMLIMSVAVIPFAFFDYFSQPAYWHPATFLSIPVGIEGVIFGFSFGGVAAAMYPAKTNNLRFRPAIDIKSAICLSPVLIISIGIWFLLDINMMISLPLGLLAGCIIIISIRRDLLRQVLLSAIGFGTLYTTVLFMWLLIFPGAQQWWDLKIYNDITVYNVPFGEVLFGFLFGGFWAGAYEFVVGDSVKVKPRSIPAPLMSTMR